jgi:hypothetical protein
MNWCARTDGLHKRAVDFHDVYRQISQVAQRRKTRSKIIERESAAECSNLIYDDRLVEHVESVLGKSLLNPAKPVGLRTDRRNFLTRLTCPSRALPRLFDP